MAQDIYIKFKGDTTHLLGSVRRVNTALGGLERSSKNASSAMGRIERSSKSASGSILNVRNALIALAGSAVIRGIVGTYTEFETFKTVLTTFLGSAELAEKRLKGLGILANSLPQDLADLTQSFTILTRNGIDTSAASLTAFSNIATANGKSMTQLGEAVADALTGEFERLKEFGIKVSKENDQFVARIGDQQVALSNSSKDLVRQLRALGEEGGRFGDAAANNANTLSQAFSNLKGAVFDANIAFMDQLKPALMQVTQSITQLIVDNRDLIVAIGEGLAGAITFAVENIGTLSTLLIALPVTMKLVAGGTAIARGAMLLFSKSITLTSIALKGLRGAIAATGFGLLFLIVTDIIGKMYEWVNSVGGVRAAFANLKNRMSEFFDRQKINIEIIKLQFARMGAAISLTWSKMVAFMADKIAGLVSTVGSLLNKASTLMGGDPFIDAMGIEAWASAMQHSVSNAEHTLNSYGEQIEVLRQQKAAIGVAAEVAADAIDTQTDATNSLGGATDDLAELLGEQDDAAGALSDTTTELTEEQKAAAKAAEDLAKANARLAQQIEDTYESFKDIPTALDIARAGIEAFNRINPLKGLTATYKKELRGIDSLRDRDLINEEEYLKTKAQLHRDYTRTIGELQKEQMLESMRTSGVSNQAVLDATATSMDNIAKIQQGGVAGAIGLADQLGTVFGSLGQQNRKAFEMAKKFNIASAIMNTAVGISKAFAMGGPLGFLTAAAVAAAGFAQVAAIRSQQYSGRALGGPVMGNTPYMVGENGPEMFVPATSGSITRNDQLDSESVNVNFTINAIDSRGVDQLLIERKSVITSIITDAMLEKGRRSRF